MKVMRLVFLFALGLAGCVVGVAAQTQTAGYVAGLHPDRRPDMAPRLDEAAARTPDQFARVLRGIDKPVPGNVQSIAATGNWWVPLRQPGMMGPYDLRGWHGKAIGAPPAAGSATM
jgi:hypothetical protein